MTSLWRDCLSHRKRERALKVPLKFIGTRNGNRCESALSRDISLVAMTCSFFVALRRAHWCEFRRRFSNHIGTFRNLRNFKMQASQKSWRDRWRVHESPFGFWTNWLVNREAFRKNIFNRNIANNRRNPKDSSLRTLDWEVRLQTECADDSAISTEATQSDECYQTVLISSNWASNEHFYF